MKVLIIPLYYPTILTPKHGNFIKNQVDALNKKTIEVSVFGTLNVGWKVLFNNRNWSKLGFYDFSEKGVVHFYTILPVIAKLPFINSIFNFHLGKLLFKLYIKKYGKPDIIHLHIFEAGRLPLYIKKRYNIPFVVTEHNSAFNSNEISFWSNKLAKRVFTNSNYNIAVSKGFSNKLENIFQTTFKYIPNFVNSDIFILRAKKEHSKLHKFIHVAYLQKIKNQALLINSFFSAFGNNENYSLKIYGDGPERENLSQLIKQLGIKNIELCGYVSQEQLSFLYSDSDYFLLSSKSETFGLVLVEAMSCGLPVLSTSSDGPDSIIDRSELGIICEHNIESYSTALKQLVSTNYNSETIRKETIEKYNSDSLSIQLIQIYKSFINI